MWYSGHNGTYWSVGYATSLDGIYWYKYPFNPVLTWDLDNTKPKHIITPSVIKDNGVYKMWFTSSYTDHDDKDFTIGYATSSDGLQWTVDDYKQLQPSQNWDLMGLTHPFVLKISDTEYYMYYSARYSQNWNIGYATSINGRTWIPSINNPIITSTGKWWEKGSNLGPYVIFDSSSNIYKMWYSTESLGQSSSSMAYAESVNNLVWTKLDSLNPILNRELTGYFDDRVISDGSIYSIGNTIYLWYGGKAFDSIWRIGLSYYGDTPVPLPTPITNLTNTPSPIPPTATPPPPSTPTSIPPTPTPRHPIVILPGMFASWNKDEMLKSKGAGGATWKLLEFVKEYNGIIATLKNLGYKENENLFIWPYDWRQSIIDIVPQLNIYLTNAVFSNPQTKSINLIGHSLGGLVARAWTQMDNNSSKVNHLITVGSPHQGVIQPYLAWEGGDIPQDNSVLSFAAQVLLHIYNKKFQTNRETIQQSFPALKDLLPSSPYLIRSLDNSDILKNQMHVWNEWQEILNNSVQSIYPIFSAISGINFDTPYKFIVMQPNKIDYLLGNWMDGKPIKTTNETGDGTVNTLRSVFSDDPSYQLNKNHGELISSEAGIDKILDLLLIGHEPGMIIESSTTTFIPGLLFLLRSPATIQVTYEGQSFNDQDGILFIPNAQEGMYAATVSGTGFGEYHLSIGQLTPNITKWSTLTKTIQNNDRHQYMILFQPSSPLELPITNFSSSDWISQLEKRILELKTIVNRSKAKRLQIELTLTKRMLENGHYFIFKIQMEHLLKSLSVIRSGASREAILKTFEIDNLISNIYISVLKNQKGLVNSRFLVQEQRYLEKEKQRLNQKIDKYRITDTIHILLFQKASEMLTSGRISLAKLEEIQASLYFLRSKLLFSEIDKFF